MSNLFDYSITPASNNSASPNGAPEGMSPSGLNDTMRQMMANQAGAFTCYTGGGTANAQTVTMSPTLAAYSNKVRIAFIPVANNTGACTLNVNSLGAVAIKMLDGTDPPAGALNSSGVSIVQHNGTNFSLISSASHVAYQEILTLDNTFTSGTAVLISVNTGSGKLVTIVMNDAGHSNSSSPVTTALIPAAYRPADTFHASSGTSGSNSQNLAIASDGTIRITYEAARTGMFAGTSVTYYVAN